MAKAKKKVAKKKVAKKRVTSKKVSLKKKTQPKVILPAYFLSLTVENVRCFGQKQEIDLSDKNGRPSQWTVILGDNNTGKTTLLQCFVAVEPTRFADYTISKLARKGEYFNLYRDLAKDEVKISGNACFSTKITDLAKNKKKNTQVFLSVTNHMSNIYSFEKVAGLKCYGYGASRVMGESLLAEKTSDDACASLFDENSRLINAEEWLLQADYSASKRSVIGLKAQEKRDQIKDVLINLLPEVDDIRITDPTNAKPNPGVEFKTPYGWVKLGALSLGYRTLIAWMVDLANRMFERYPRSANPLAEPAIVLVDEIDLHLHPRWQRTIMQYLSDRFKNTQFIATAHSPLVVQGATNANIVLLKREGDHVVIDNNPRSVRGWRADQILTGLFDLESSRSVEIEQAQKERRKILSKAKLTAAGKRKLKTLESKMGDLPTAETLEDIEAMDIIRQAAKSLKKNGSGHK